MTTPGPAPDPAHDPVPAHHDEPVVSTRRTIVEYTVLRLGMFIGVAALMLVFVRGQDGFFLAIIVAALVSGVASYFLLQRQRAPLAMALDRRLSASRAASARKTASEDAVADALRRDTGEQ